VHVLPLHENEFFRFTRSKLATWGGIEVLFETKVIAE